MNKITALNFNISKNLDFFKSLLRSYIISAVYKTYASLQIWNFAYYELNSK